MGNSASRKAGSASSPQSPVNSPNPHSFQSIPPSAAPVSVRVPTGWPSPPPPPPASAAVPNFSSPQRSAAYPVPQSQVSSPCAVPTSATMSARSNAPGGRSMPIGIPGSVPASSNMPTSSHAQTPPGYSHSQRAASRYSHYSGSNNQQSLGPSTRLNSEDLLANYRNEYARPPRLPLPIGDDTAVTGDTAVSNPIPGIDSSALLVHGTSSGDNNDSVAPGTIETSSDEDEGSEGRSRQLGLVPTLIEWTGSGSRVYVTGTFANWNRKYRLHRSGPSKRAGAMSTVLNLKPGTHHLKFIVDNDLQLSTEIPTTVDFTNVLVNYIDVDPETAYIEPATSEAGEAQSSHSGGTAWKKAKEKLDKSTQQRIAIPEELAGKVHEPFTVLPPGTVVCPAPPGITGLPARLQVHPNTQYHRKIPRILLDLEEEPETMRSARSAEAINRLYVPATLPMFLSKSILNTATPKKDDSSVLATPNHTILNHLATSSIKQGVLATSVTTRYRRKFLTTIMHKPVEEGQA